MTKRDGEEFVLREALKGAKYVENPIVYIV